MVHRGSVAATANILNLVNSTCVEKNTFAERCLSRVDVSRDTDVSKFVEVHGSEIESGR